MAKIINLKNAVGESRRQVPYRRRSENPELSKIMCQSNKSEFRSEEK